ncbi:hypothetical protein D3C78_831390 [compost metagenome]
MVVSAQTTAGGADGVGRLGQSVKISARYYPAEVRVGGGDVGRPRTCSAWPENHDIQAISHKEALVGAIADGIGKCERGEGQAGYSNGRGGSVANGQGIAGRAGAFAGASIGRSFVLIADRILGENHA